MLKKVLFATIILNGLIFAKESPVAKDVKRMKFPELKWEVPEVGKDITKIELESGTTIYAKENRTLPLVEITVYTKGGASYLPEGYKLHPTLLINSMIKGGTKSFTSEEILDSLEYYAINVNGEVSDEYFAITFTFDPKFKDLVEKLIKEILFMPRFEEKVVNLEKNKILDVWNREMDEPGNLLYELRKKILYKGNPLSVSPDTFVFKQTTREELLTMHKKFFQPKNMSLSIVGDFDNGWLERTFPETFAPSFNNDEELKVQKPQHSEGGKVYFCQRPIPQGYVLFIQDMPNGYFEDIFKLFVAADILGGGFNSKIVSKVRNEMGLAYSAYASFGLISNIKGAFYAFTATRSDAVDQSIYYIFDAIKQMIEGKITESEFKLAKDSFVNSTITSIRSDWSYVKRLALRRLLNFPDDYFLRMNKEIAKMSLQDVKEVSKKYLKPESISLIIVGDSTKIKMAELEKFGKIEYIDLF